MAQAKTLPPVRRTLFGSVLDGGAVLTVEDRTHDEPHVVGGSTWGLFYVTVTGPDGAVDHRYSWTEEAALDMAARVAATGYWAAGAFAAPVRTMPVTPSFACDTCGDEPGWCPKAAS